MERRLFCVLLMLILIFWGGWMAFDCLEEQLLTKDLKIFVISEEAFEEDTDSQTWKPHCVITTRSVVDAGGVVLLLLGAGLLLTTVLIQH